MSIYLSCRQSIRVLTRHTTSYLRIEPAVIPSVHTLSGNEVRFIRKLVCHNFTLMSLQIQKNTRQVPTEYLCLGFYVRFGILCLIH